MDRYYCTYFDHRYLARGLAMIRSLRRHEPNARIWVLCLSDVAFDTLTQKNEPGVTPIRLSDFESGDEALQRAKADGRSVIEYYFTCTPSLVRYVFEAAPDADMVTYLDGDLWFFANPEPIYQEAEYASVIIIAHGFALKQKHLVKFGVYNVGWVSFRRNDQGLACLEWWRGQCLDWCRDELDEANRRFADQRYLDRFAELFSGVHAVGNQGANLAPWNVAGRHLAQQDGHILVNRRDRLIFFHFHGIKRLSGRYFLTGHYQYGGSTTRLMKREIYAPYLREVMMVERELQPEMPAVSARSLRYAAKAFTGLTVGTVKKTINILRAANSLIVLRQVDDATDAGEGKPLRVEQEKRA